MSLDWNVESVKDFETLCWIEEEKPPSQGPGTHKRVNPVTEALVFHCLGIGMREITEKNVDEFLARVQFVEKHQGASVKRFGEAGVEDRPITREDVQAHIGLSTNVSNEPLGRWLTRNFRHFYGLKVD